MSHGAIYQLVKSAKSTYEHLIPTQFLKIVDQPEKLAELRITCEMILVREFDDWYVGEPTANISHALHKFCERLANKRDKEHLHRVIRTVGATLAWIYVKVDHDSDDAYLLVTHVMNHLEGKTDNRILPAECVSELAHRLAQWREDRGMPRDLSKLTHHQREIWDEITRWEIDPISSTSGLSKKLDSLKDAVMSKVPESISKPIADAMEGWMNVLHDVSDKFVRKEVLVKEVASDPAVLNSGLQVEKIEDLRKVHLEVLDRISLASLRGGKALAGGEGVLAGLAGFVGMAIDVPGLMSINLRFINQIANTYGFDIMASEEERLFAFSVLGASNTSQAAKATFLKQLNEIAVAVAKRKTWKDLSKSVIVQVLQQIAKIVGIRLTKKKLTQVIPILGSLTAGGSNYKFTHDNLVAARMMYRKRWLIEHCLRLDSPT